MISELLMALQEILPGTGMQKFPTLSKSSFPTLHRLLMMSVMGCRAHCLPKASLPSSYCGSLSQTRDLSCLWINFLWQAQESYNGVVGVQASRKQARANEGLTPTSDGHLAGPCQGRCENPLFQGKGLFSNRYVYILL